MAIRDLDDAEFWLEALLTLKYGPGTVAHQLQVEAQELRAGLATVAWQPARPPELTAHSALEFT
jgi:hypothetical protein